MGVGDSDGRRAGWLFAARAVGTSVVAAAPARPADDTCSDARSRSCAGSLRGRRLGLGCAEVAEDVLEAIVAEHRALEPGRADLDAEQVEEVVGAQGGDVLERLALDLVGQQARARLADRAATTGEPDTFDDAVLDAEHQR